VGERAFKEASSFLLFIFGHGGSEAEAMGRVAKATRSADYTADVEARITTINS
jgi:hypothetical protein